MKQVRFHTPEMGAVGHTRWYSADEEWPTLDWSKVTSIETSEGMTVSDFKERFPLVQFP